MELCPFRKEYIAYRTDTSNITIKINHPEAEVIRENFLSCKEDACALWDSVNCYCCIKTKCIK